MGQQVKHRTMIRLSPETQEKVAQWAAIMGMSRAKVLTLAMNHWAANPPLGIHPSSDTNAQNEPQD